MEYPLNPEKMKEIDILEWEMHIQSRIETELNIHLLDVIEKNTDLMTALRSLAEGCYLVGYGDGLFLENETDNPNNLNPGESQGEEEKTNEPI